MGSKGAGKIGRWGDRGMGSRGAREIVGHLGVEQMEKK